MTIYLDVLNTTETRLPSGLAGCQHFSGLAQALIAEGNPNLAQDLVRELSAAVEVLEEMSRSLRPIY